jgi:hypothetical protein
MQDFHEIKKVSHFGVSGDYLTFDGVRFEVETMGEPIAQFRYGDKFLLVLPDDPFEYALFFLVLLNAKLRPLEYHSAPENADEAVAPSVEIRSKSSISLDWGPANRWTVEILPKPRYMPLAAYRRATKGWLPLFEYPLFVRRSYLKIIAVT